MDVLAEVVYPEEASTASSDLELDRKLGLEIRLMEGEHGTETAAVASRFVVALARRIGRLALLNGKSHGAKENVSRMDVFLLACERVRFLRQRGRS